MQNPAGNAKSVTFLHTLRNGIMRDETLPLLILYTSEASPWDRLADGPVRRCGMARRAMRPLSFLPPGRLHHLPQCQDARHQL